jgi:single-strand DNA-binding protein
MDNLNSVLIEGRLTRDAEKSVTAAAAGAAVCGFTVASSRHYKDGNGVLIEEVCFFDVTAQGKLVEACMKLGKKESGVRIVGRLHQEYWGYTDGRRFSKVTIIAEHVEFRKEVTQAPEVQINGEGAA